MNGNLIIKIPSIVEQMTKVIRDYRYDNNGDFPKELWIHEKTFERMGNEESKEGKIRYFMGIKIIICKECECSFFQNIKNDVCEYCGEKIAK